MAIELPINYLVGIVIVVMIILLAVTLLATSQGLANPLIDQIDRLLKAAFGG